MKVMSISKNYYYFPLHLIYFFVCREFLKSLALFSKPLVAGVHGAAVGLGVTMLPFFDMVFASDKATFYTPYAKLGQVPEGAAILTLPHMLGNAVVSINLSFVLAINDIDNLYVIISREI